MDSEEGLYIYNPCIYSTDTGVQFFRNKVKTCGGIVGSAPSHPKGRQAALLAW